MMMGGASFGMAAPGFAYPGVGLGVGANAGASAGPHGTGAGIGLSTATTPYMFAPMYQQPMAGMTTPQQLHGQPTQQTQ